MALIDRTARAERIRATHEQARADADAAVERRAQERRDEIALAREKMQFDGERRQAKLRARTERRQRRQFARRRVAERIRQAAPAIGRRALIAIPILFPMAVAWIGQIGFAVRVLGWPGPASVVFAGAWELTTAFAAWMYHQARREGDAGVLYRGASWVFAAAAGTMNYWHAAGPDWAPNGAAVSYGVMSIVGIALWELYATLIHRQALRDRDMLPPARPRFGASRWLLYARITRRAMMIAVRDDLTTTSAAWSAALAERGQRTARREARRKRRRADRAAKRTKRTKADGAPVERSASARLADSIAAMSAGRSGQPVRTRLPLSAVPRFADLGAPADTMGGNPYEVRTAAGTCPDCVYGILRDAIDVFLDLGKDKSAIVSVVQRAGAMSQSEAWHLVNLMVNARDRAAELSGQTGGDRPDGGPRLSAVPGARPELAGAGGSVPPPAAPAADSDADDGSGVSGQPEPYDMDKLTDFSGGLAGPPLGARLAAIVGDDDKALRIVQWWNDRTASLGESAPAIDRDDLRAAGIRGGNSELQHVVRVLKAQYAEMERRSDLLAV